MKTGIAGTRTVLLMPRSRQSNVSFVDIALRLASASRQLHALSAEQTRQSFATMVEVLSQDTMKIDGYS